MQPPLRAWETRADQRGLVCSDSTWPTTINVALQGGSRTRQAGFAGGQRGVSPSRSTLQGVSGERPSWSGPSAACAPGARQPHVDATLVGHKANAAAAALRAHGGEEGDVLLAALQRAGREGRGQLWSENLWTHSRPTPQVGARPGMGGIARLGRAGLSRVPASFLLHCDAPRVITI